MFDSSKIELPCAKIYPLPDDLLEIVGDICCCQQTPCSCPPFALYLVGSRVHDLINKTPSQDENDYDFLLISDSPEWLQRGSFSNYIRHKYINNYFIRDTNTYGGASVDIVMSSSCLYDNAFSRDLTMCALFLRVNGNDQEQGCLYDPTGRGLSDLSQKILNTIDEPSMCFARDPSRVLRVMKYLMRGYVPSPALASAMFDWNDPSCFNDNHFTYVLTQYLESFYYLEFIEQMKKYQLINKLGVVGVKNEDEANYIARALLSDLYMRFYRCAQQQLFTLSERRSQAEKYNYKLLNKIFDARQKIDELQRMTAIEEHCMAENIWQMNALTLRNADKIMEKQHQMDPMSVLKASEDKYRDLIRVNKELSIQHQEKIEQEVKKISEKISSDMMSKKEKILKQIEKEKNTLQSINDKIAEKKKSLDACREKLRQTRAKSEENIQRRNELIAEKRELSDGVLSSMDHGSDVSTKTIEEPEARVDKKTPEPVITKSVSKADCQSYKQKYLLAIDMILQSSEISELESLFLKTGDNDFRAVMGYKLGMWHFNSGNYFKAMNFFYAAYYLEPNYLSREVTIEAVKSKCTSINWCNSSPRHWQELGAEAKKNKKYDEAITYYYVVLELDENHINAYVGLLNIFYKQDDWINFCTTYSRLLIVMSNIWNGAPVAMQANLCMITQALKNQIQLGKARQISMHEQNVPINEVLRSYWHTIVITKIHSDASENAVQEQLECALRIVALESNKSVEYGLAHYDLARYFFKLGSIEYGARHAYEAMCVLPCLKYIFINLDDDVLTRQTDVELRTIDDYICYGQFLENQHCYFLAFSIFRQAIENFPEKPQAYWALINCAYSMNRPDLLCNQLLGRFIELYKGMRQTLSDLEYYKIMTELYLYRQDYANSRIFCAKLIEVSPSILHLNSFNFKTILSPQLIDEVREKNKQRYLRLSDKFDVTAYLENIERDENRSTGDMSQRPK